MPRARPRPAHGAALLLLLMMLGLGAAALLINVFGLPDTQAQRPRATLSALAEAREALLGYALVHGRLPRPATSATNGVESAQACADAAACSGFLPWVTLGVDGADSWGKLIRYSVTPAFTEAPLRQAGTIADKRVRDRGGDGAPYYRLGTGLCDVEHQCAPAVLFSSGRHNPGVAVSGIRQLSDDASNLDERYNDSAVNDFMARPATRPGERGAAGGEFDDLVLWLPLSTLYQRMGVAGVLN
jgi:type II secretory pathway pseudopilin PulG